MSGFEAQPLFGPRRFEEAVRRWNNAPAVYEGKIPAWTAEDEANLAKRVQRLAAKAKP